jgi:hypothetical protein
MEDKKEGTVGSVGGEIAIEKVFAQDEISLYRAKAVLLNFNSPSYDFTNTSFTYLRNPVPVYSDGRDKKIGYANVYIENNRLVADIGIDYATEERFIAETKSEKMWPRFFGEAAVAAIHLFDFGGKLPVSQVRVYGIVISREQPSDKNIPSFGEPVL